MSQLSDHTPSTCTDGDDSSTEEGEEFVTAEFSECWPSIYMLYDLLLTADKLCELQMNSVSCR